MSAVPSTALVPSIRPSVAIVPAGPDLDDFLAGQLSAQTRRAYAQDLADFGRFVGLPANPDADDLIRCATPQAVTAWRDSMLAAGKSSATVARKMSAVRSAFHYLRAAGLIDRNPIDPKLVKSPKTSHDGKTPGMSQKQARALLDATDGDTLVDRRDRALIGLALYTGLRRAEIAALRIGDVSQDAAHWVVNVAHGKGDKFRRVPLPPTVKDAIDGYLVAAGRAGADPQEALFQPTRNNVGGGFTAKPLTGGGVWVIIKRRCRAAGLPANLTTHSTRVTAATQAHRAGCALVDIADYLGHADPRTTSRYIRRDANLASSPAYRITY